MAVSEPILEALARHRELQDEEKQKAGDAYQDHGLVLQTELGTPLTPGKIDVEWSSLLRKCDVPKIRFHDLRHTHATLLLKQGVHPKIVSERLGHANIGITLDIYSHVLPNLQQNAVEQLSEIIDVNGGQKKGRKC